MYSFQAFDLLPYIFLLILFWGVSKSRFSSRKKAGVIIFCLVLFDSLRYGVGYDYINYVNEVYEQDVPFTTFLEPLSQLLMFISHYTHYQVFFIVSTFITLYSVLFFCKRYSPNPYLSIFLFFTFPYFFLSWMSIVRNALAFSMVLFAIHYLLNHKIVKSLLFCLIAFGFHTSALIAFLIYPIYLVRIGRFPSLLIVLASFCLSKFIVPLATLIFSGLPFFWKLEHYIDDMASAGTTITFLINGLGLLAIIFWKRIERYQIYGPFFLRLFIAGICFWNLFLPLNSVIGERFSTYFLLSYIVLFASLAVSFRKKSVRLCVVAMSTLLFASSFYLSVSGFNAGKTIKMSNMPYQTIFFHKNYSNLLMDNKFE